MISYKVIGRHIRSARMRMELSQEDVAQRAGISATYYGKIERGDIRPNLNRLADLCLVLQVPIEDLLRGCMVDTAPQNNHDPSSTTSDRFIADMGSSIRERTKLVLLEVCRLIVSLEDA